MVCLAELQDLPQWVVWRAELEDGRPKKVPYNPNYGIYRHEQASKFPKVGERLPMHCSPCKAATIQVLAL